MWKAVTPRFRKFLGELKLTDLQIEGGLNTQSGVRRRLNSHYFGFPSEDNALLVGSWGKFTRMRPPRDIDLLFELPPAVHARFEKHTGNKQSELLQEVKRVLQGTYPQTTMRGDGQVVLVAFNTITVEVIPAFKLTSGQYWICDTNDGGSYITTDPVAEMEVIQSVDTNCNRNLRPLIKMLKAWQAHCNVPLKSFILELLATEYIQTCQWRDRSLFYYDWIVRDFFRFLVTKAFYPVFVPGTNEMILLNNEWLSRAQTALSRVELACAYEHLDQIALAGDEWQKVFGPQIPKMV